MAILRRHFPRPALRGGWQIVEGRHHHCAAQWRPRARPRRDKRPHRQEPHQIRNPPSQATAGIAGSRQPHSLPQYLDSRVIIRLAVKRTATKKRKRRINKRPFASLAHGYFIPFLLAASSL